MIASSDNISKVYFRRFTQHIKTTYNFKKTVEDYARDLAISSGHLNHICHTIVDKSPKDVIIEYFILEAQIALTNVEKTITEVSYQLKVIKPCSKSLIS
jgi:AraC family transcriptional activator of pobA